MAKGRRVVASFAHRAVGAVAMRRGHDNSGAADCRFAAGRLVVSVSVSGAPDAYAVMMRGAEEEAQIFGAKRPYLGRLRHDLARGPAP